MRGSSRLLVPTAAIFAAWFFSASANAAEFQRRILSDGLSVALFNPAVAADRNGNLHIAAQGQPVPLAADQNTNRNHTEIYYLLVDSAGTVLIGPTQVNVPDSVKDGRPDIGVTSSGKAVIVWVKPSSAQPRYVLIDPSGAPHNGLPATPASILVIPETTVTGTTAGGSAEPRVAVDRNDIVHVVRAINSNLRYFSFNPATNTPVTADETVGNPAVRGHQPAMALDSRGNVHIAFASRDINSNGPAAYMMLNGANGAVLIAPSQLFTAATGVHPHAAHLSLMVDSTDIVHIVYGDKRNTVDANSWCNKCESGGDHFYIQLIPGNAPKNGSAVNIGSIRRLSEVALSGVWYGRAFLYGGRIHLFGTSHSGGDLVYRSIAAGGSTPSEPRVYRAQLVAKEWSRPYPVSAAGWLIWSEGASNASQGTARLVMARLPTS